METIIFPLIIGILLFIGLAAFAFWIWALIDCISSDVKTEQKLLWVIIIVLLNIIGAILYFLFSNKEGFKIETKNKKGKKLTRSSEDSMFFGVCGGIAKYFNVDSAVVRIAWVLMTFLISGFGLFLYIIAAIVMPLDKKKKESKKETKFYLTLFIVLFVIISVVLSGIIASFVLYSSVKEITVEEIREDAFEKEIRALILESNEYNEYLGSDLTLVNKQRAPEDYCEQKENNVRISIFGEGCTKYMHSFEVDHPEIQAFEVETIVVRGKIVNTTYTELPTYEFHNCTEEQRNVEVCTMIYAPVCGYYEEGRETFSNDCVACANPEVIKWRSGEC